MFGYGSSSGLLGDLKQVLDSSRNERSTQQSKADISSSLSKMNAATVGAFNKAQEEKALARAEREADPPEGIGGLNEARREELFARIEKQKTEEILKAAGYTNDGTTIKDKDGNVVGVLSVSGKFMGGNEALMEEYKKAEAEAKEVARAEADDMKRLHDSGIVSDDDLIERAGGKDFGWYVTDTMNAVGDAISDGYDWLKDKADMVGGLISDAFGLIKGGMCTNAPYPECVGCPNRPKLARKRASSGLGDVMGFLKNGLTSAVNGILDCPGTSKALVNGDFKKVGGALATGALTTACKTAASLGSAVVYKGLSELAGSAIGGAGTIGTLIGNIPGSGAALGAVGSVMDKFGVTAGDIFSAGVEFGTSYATKKLLASDKLGAGMLAGIINNDPTLAARATVPQIKSLIKTGSTRTKHKLTSSKLASLPGGMSVSTFKTSFSIESIKTGWKPPRCTRVRRRKSVADALW